jgi:hypothetical protein
MYLKLAQLKASFPQQRWSDVFDWLLAQPEVRHVILRHLAAEQ